MSVAELDPAVMVGLARPVDDSCNVLEEHGLANCMDAVYGVDMPGSKAEKILRAKGQFAAQAGMVFMVGDSCSDIRAARQAGVNAIAVSWGHQNMGMLIRALPDLVVQFPEELIEAVQLTARGL